MTETLGGEAASLREAPLPPDPSLPKSGWRLRRLLLRSGFRLRVGRASFVLGLWSRRLCQPPCLQPAHRKRAQLAWAHKSAGKLKPIPSHSSGEGVWGRGASLREAASPPESPPPCFLCKSPRLPLPFLSCLCYNKNRIDLHVKEEFLCHPTP